MLRRQRKSKATGPLSSDTGKGATFASLSASAAIGRATSTNKAAEELRQQQQEAADLESQRIKALTESNKGCFISNGEKICNGGQGTLFVSPKQFGKNIERFIKEDLPKASLGATLALTAGVDIPLVILAAAAATRGITFQQSGFGIGNQPRGSRRNV